MSESTKAHYSISYEDRKGYLYASVYGIADSLSVSKAYWTDIISETLKRQTTRLLVEESFKTQISTIEMYELAGYIAELAYGKGLRIAFIDKETEHNSLNLFGETVAKNRGTSGKLFSSVVDAEE